MMKSQEQSARKEKRNAPREITLQLKKPHEHQLRILESPAKRKIVKLVGLVKMLNLGQALQPASAVLNLILMMFRCLFTGFRQQAKLHVPIRFQAWDSGVDSRSTDHSP